MITACPRLGSSGRGGASSAVQLLVRCHGIVELAAVEAVVDVTPVEELRVLPPVHDGAAIQDQNAVGPDHGGKAVGDDQRGPAGHEMIQGILDQGFAFCIEAGGGFVQDEDRGFFSMTRAMAIRCL